MAITYTLNFSDPRKTSTITISGPTRNNYSTSLDLVGPGYIAYGETIAQDFVKLLENFASPNPPSNPIEGQLWYDTRDPFRKILRINNGTVTSARWPSATGIYQQATDPADDYSQNLIDGDVWVDTGHTQLYIRYSNTWKLVGPAVSTGSNKTGTESVELDTNTNETYPAILNWVNGRVISIIAYHTFTPRTVIDGFSSLNPGINLTTRVPAKFNGLADRAKTLEISNGVYIQANEVLKNTVPASQRQLHAGSLIIESAQGLFVRRPNQSNREIKIATTGSSQALIEYGLAAGSLKIGVTSNSYVNFNGDQKSVAINTSTVEGVTLTVDGSATFKNKITITTSSSTTVVLDLQGSATIAGSTTIDGNLNVYGATEISTASVLTVGNIVPTDAIRSIGTVDTPFEYIHVVNIGTTSSNIRIYGTTDETIQLQTEREFQILGVVTSTAVAFNGTNNVTLLTTLNSTAITDQPNLAIATSTATIMIVENGSLSKINKGNLLADVFSTGMIMAYATSATTATITAGWLYCDGSEYISTATTYSNLFNLIGYQYGTPVDPLKFKVPDLTTATVSGTNGFPIYYHIKT